MRNDSTIIDSLRSMRHADETLMRLQEGTLEALRPALQEALNDPEWGYGPADLIGVYGSIRKILAKNKRGDTFRITVEEKENQMILGKVEVFETALPSMDIAQEMLESAKEASLAIMEDDADRASPLLKAMSKALDVSGDLQKRITVEMDLQTLHKTQWYHEIVEKNYNDAVLMPSLVQESEVTLDNLNEACSNLAGFLAQEMSETLSSLRKIVDTPHDKTFAGLAKAVSEDMKRAVSALNSVQTFDADSKIRVFESVSEVAPRLVASSRFIGRLANEATN